MIRRLPLIALLIAPLFCVATTVIPVSVEELARSASQVVKVRALDSWSAWNPQHTLIYTYAHVQVVHRIKGGGPDTIVVKQLGGSAGGYTQKVAGVRYFLPGEDALLFLRPSEANDGTMVVVGLMQGNFRIYQTPAGHTMVSNGMPSASASRQGKIGSFTGSAMRLEEVEARVRRTLP